MGLHRHVETTRKATSSGIVADGMLVVVQQPAELLHAVRVQEMSLAKRDGDNPKQLQRIAFDRQRITKRMIRSDTADHK